MLYTSQLAKEYLEQAQEVGKRNAEFENMVDPIINQMSSTLINNHNSFRKSMNKELSEECISYLEYAGIDVQFLGFGAIGNQRTCMYKFTF